MRGLLGSVKDCVSKILPDKLYLSILFRYHMGYWMDWDNPTTFSEKLQWLKIYDRNPLYTKLVDKFAVKEHVAKEIGEEYIIPTLGVWDRVENIEWDKLPQQFVLKTTHGGGNMGVVICRDKDHFNRVEAIKRLTMSLKNDLYVVWKEWPYKNVTRRIIAEKYIEPTSDKQDLPDYKLFCFNGKVKILYVATGRQLSENPKFDFFDSDFNHLPFCQDKHPNASILPTKPVHFELMKQLAEKLSQGIPHVRIDFYESGNRVYFGEMTFYSMSGMTPFHPKEWDNQIGSYLKLPS